MHMRQPKQKHIPKSAVKLVGGHPLIFTTAKLDFDKRHRDKIIPTAFSLHDHSPEISLQAVVFLVSLSLCIGL